MYTVDGNDSLKRITRIGLRNIGDTWCFTDSDYFIPSEEVDQWAKEAKSGADGLEHGGVETEDGVEEEADLEGEASSSNPGPCANNWKVAQSDLKKHMWGIFAGAYRHGFILCIVDMVLSGEQYIFGYTISKKQLTSCFIEPSIPLRLFLERCKSLAHGCFKVMISVVFQEKCHCKFPRPTLHWKRVSLLCQCVPWLLAQLFMSDEESPKYHWGCRAWGPWNNGVGL